MGGDKKKTSGQSGHKALYRKHRSQSFDEVKGQDHITKTLQAAIKKGKTSHAYLFTGPRGVGKTSIARILAHEVNNLPYSNDSTHLDIIEIDAASNRRIDDIRDLREKVHIAPVSAKYKVYIIDEVHMLTPESFNALLKTLEEPPEHVIFILATTEAHKLPATIISRTQRHHFRSIPTREVTEHLKDIAKKEGISITDGALNLLATHGGGSFRDGISLLDHLSGASEHIDEELVSLMLGIAPSDKISKLLAAAKAGENKSILDQLETLLNDGISPIVIAGQCIESIRGSLATADIVSAEELSLIDKLSEVENAINPKLKLETVLLSYSLDRSPPVVTPGKTESQPKDNTPKPPITKEPKSEKKNKKTFQQPKPAPSKDASEIKPTGKMSSDIDEWWPKVLTAVKKINNPLYTILRLAKPKLVSESNLELAFGFEFHRKRIDDSKYRSIIGNVCQEVIGTIPEITTTVEKDLAHSQIDSFSMPEEAPQPLDPAQASQIAAIQDIMGGGEIMQHA